MFIGLDEFDKITLYEFRSILGKFYLIEFVSLDENYKKYPLIVRIFIEHSSLA